MLASNTLAPPLENPGCATDTVHTINKVRDENDFIEYWGITLFFPLLKKTCTQEKGQVQKKYLCNAPFLLYEICVDFMNRGIYGSRTNGCLDLFLIFFAALL